ncbi:hypothetical protein B0H13DRAFT_1870464 [Mycena leptocephala]|nr:hypothetical protein B0H13DRAFT_1870464 [Mycena leptocephala]
MCYKPGKVLPAYNGLSADIVRYDASPIFPTIVAHALGVASRTFGVHGGAGFDRRDRIAQETIARSGRGVAVGQHARSGVANGREEVAKAMPARACCLRSIAERGRAMDARSEAEGWTQGRPGWWTEIGWGIDPQSSLSSVRGSLGFGGRQANSEDGIEVEWGRGGASQKRRGKVDRCGTGRVSAARPERGRRGAAGFDGRAQRGGGRLNREAAP